MKNLRTPFFCVNPKLYLYGKGLLELALTADKLAAEHDLDIFFTVPFPEIALIASQTENLIITAQHMDGLVPGKGMGHILPESLKAAGAKAAFLNHAEHPLTFSEIEKAAARAKELDLMTIICADSVAEGKAVAQLEPTVIVCEPTELIGTGQTSDPAYMKAGNEVIKKVSPNTRVLQAAGISTVADVKKAMDSGADGTGGTSGIVCAKDPQKTLVEMIACVAAYQ